MKTTRFLKSAMAALTLICSVTTTMANDDTMSLSLSRNAEAMGTLRGRVLDKDKNFLAGAAVYIKELNRGVATDANGFFTMAAVQTGTYNVEVSYVGFDVTSKSVTIETNKTVVTEIEMVEVATAIEDVVVTSVMKDQARALSTQKSALNMMDVISSDQASKYPDSNIGDALKRISGVNVQYDQGEARFGQVRGTPAEMTSVTINGDRMPSAEDGTRSVQLDLIPADMVQTIEVNKVVTPDMDADAIGGSVNLITKNSPSRQIATASVGVGYDMIGEKANPSFGVTYGNVTSDNKFGYIISASYLNNHMGSDNTEFEWVEGEDGKDYVDDYQIRQYYVQRERQSYSASFNYNINKNHKIDFKGLYNRRNDWENRYRTKVKDLTKDMDEGDDYGVNGKIAIETKGGSADSNYSRLERQQTMDFTLGGEHLFGKIMMDWTGSWARATEDRPEERYVSYELKTEEVDGIKMDYSDMRQPYAKAGDGSVIALTDKYELADLSESNKEVKESDLKFKMNFTLPLSESTNNSTLKFGTKIASKDKSSETTAYQYVDEDVNPSYTNAQTASYATIKLQDREGFMPGAKYNYGRTFVDREWLGDQNFNDTSVYDPAGVSQIFEESAGNYTATENVYSAYLRYDKKFGKDVDFMAGLRMEHTNVSYTGTRWAEADENASKDETLETIAEQSNKYTNYLPSVMVKWNASRDLKLRASFTNTLARPNYSDLAPSIEINDDQEATFGNPDLKPALSYNVDLSADYYFKNIGLIRGGIFYKRINDFIVDQNLGEQTIDGYEYSEVSQAINGGNADLLGFEANYQRDLSFISPSLSFMGLAGTYTYTYSNVSDFNYDGRENDTLSLPGSPEHTANASIYAEKWGVSLRLSYNYASDFIDELGKSEYYDRYYDSVNYLDLNMSYNFKKKFTLFADVTNLTNQPLRYYQGSKDRTMQVEYYGPRINAGFKVIF